ncbi:ExbD/TolR family protein [Notoacmeibacter ruber]|uniref:Biopolymer transporter ExbD n=1 Tax=Notoacmeibacter ruber TaxID=2670375 RepID=A0A3L7JC73_9HYPH|nr:biopolymer transporter ExbD [Notoacmeibacter ruber]RLQ88253.1 biopolymer transporter ExbD [Notoacmeibacter ruber]
MRIDAAIRRRKRMSMTSLIDVIFLLLLFFMLSSTFSRFAEVPIGSAGNAGTGANRPDIVATIDAEGVQINGEQVPADRIADRLASLREAGAASATLFTRDGATSQTLVATLERFRASGIETALAR